MLKSIAYVIQHANFQLYRAYVGRVIWKSRQMMTNICKNEIHQTMRISKIMCQEEKKNISFVVAMKTGSIKRSFFLKSQRQISDFLVFSVSLGRSDCEKFQIAFPYRNWLKKAFKGIATNCDNEINKLCCALSFGTS